MADFEPLNLRHIDSATVTPQASADDLRGSRASRVAEYDCWADETDVPTAPSESTEETDRSGTTEPVVASVVDSGIQTITFRALEAVLDGLQPGWGWTVGILRRGLEVVAALNSYRAGRGFGINIPVAVSEETGFILNLRPTVAAKDWSDLPPAAFTVDWSSDSSAGPGVDQGSERLTRAGSGSPLSADAVKPTDHGERQATRSGEVASAFVVIAPREEVGLAVGADRVDADVLARYVQSSAAAAAIPWDAKASGDARSALRKRRRRVEAVSLLDLAADPDNPRRRVRCVIFYLDPGCGCGVVSVVPADGTPYSPILLRAIESAAGGIQLHIWPTSEPVSVAL